MTVVMGSGKSTTVTFIAASLEAAHRLARPITEMTDPHPVRATDGLRHWYQPWLDVTPAELAERSLSKWRTFVDAARALDSITILDGQLFHGDLTNLFLMEAERDAIAAYSRAVEEVIRPLAPLLVYLYQDDVDRAIRAIAAERGSRWVKYQVDWKLEAPYARRRALTGVDGLIALYTDYRALTDELYAQLTVPKLAIETSAHAWERDYDRIMRAVL